MGDMLNYSHRGASGEFKAMRNTSKNLLNLVTSRRDALLIARLFFSFFFFLKDYYRVFPYRVVHPITATAKGEGRWFTKAFHNISLIYKRPKRRPEISKHAKERKNTQQVHLTWRVETQPSAAAIINMLNWIAIINKGTGLVLWR